MQINRRRLLIVLGLGAMILNGGLLSGCIPSVPTLPVSALETNWPVEGGNEGRTRESVSQLAPPLILEHEVPIGESGEFVSPVTYAEGFVYADGEASLHVFPASSDEAAWEIRLPGYFLSPLVQNKRVFVRAESAGVGFLFALDAQTGAKDWQFQFPQVGSEHQNIGGHVTSPVLAGGKLLVASARVFYALNPSTGQVEWELPLEEAVASSPAAENGLAYISDFTRTYAVDIASGEEQWRFTGQEPSLYFAPVIRDGRVFVGLGTQLLALDAQTGDELWRTEIGTSPVVPAGATADLVFGKSVQTLTAYDPQEGTPMWNYTTLNFISLPAISENHLFTIIRLGHGSQLIALSLHTGEEVWHSGPLDLARSAPIIASGKVYVRSESGTIVALSADPDFSSG